ncbi:MAG: Gfo/Idh/MocA family oxidoreductase [Lachnospirales bacterium]
MKEVKIGIVGLGRLGYEHARNIAFNIPNAKLVAICSLDKELCEKLKNHWSIAYSFTNFKSMVELECLDAVVIASPSSLHLEHIELALKKNLHVFVDKPLGITIEECKKAESLVANHPNKIFMVGFMRRFDPSYAYAKKLIDEGAIGTPFLGKFISLDPEKKAKSVIPFLKSSGGIFIDMGVHDYDLIRWLLNSEVKEIYAIGGAYVHKEEYEQEGDCDNGCALLKLEKEKMAFLHVGRNAPHGYHIETEITGTKGVLRIGNDPKKNLVTIYNDHGVLYESPEGFQERFKEAFLLELVEFINCILECRSPSVGVADGTKSTEIAFATTKAFKNKEVIKMV